MGLGCQWVRTMHLTEGMVMLQDLGAMVEISMGDSSYFA
jgi:hypothetical protein